MDQRECHAVSVVRMAADGGAEDVSHRLVPVRSFAELPGRRMGNGEGLAEDLVAACWQGVQVHRVVRGSTMFSGFSQVVFFCPPHLRHALVWYVEAAFARFH